MTRAQICEALSTALEVKPPRSARDYTCSPLRFWYWNWAAIKPGWEPADFFVNEDASARLLDAMPQVQLSQNEGVWQCQFCYIHTPFKYSHHEVTTDRKIAVVLAACLWKVIQYGTLED